jgi:hypothetical protein
MTLRRRNELVAIVCCISQKGMRPALFTNGIRAKRDLLEELVEACLVDVAFHVDMTQRRNGYKTEGELNDVRQGYIERARGLPLPVLFNTTVCNGNFAQMAEIVAFFVRNCDVVRLGLFQLQAEIGRSILGRRVEAMTIKSVQQKIEEGAGTVLSFDTAHIGHSLCNRHSMTFVTNGRAYDVLDDPALFQQILARTAHLAFDRRSRVDVGRTFVAGLLANPAVWPSAIRRLCRKLWMARSDLMAAGGCVHKLSFFIHNFIDACSVERERIESCSFMAVTQDGPLSMCLYNAKRDAFIFAPVRLSGSGDGRYWDPVTGMTAGSPTVSLYDCSNPTKASDLCRKGRAVSN